MDDFDDTDENSRNKKEGDYEVGKGKPPKKTQFKSGDEWTGNRNGRPKGSRNFDTEMHETFSEKLPITDPQTGRKLNGYDATTRQLRNKAVKGDPRAMQLFLDWWKSQTPRDHEKEGEAPPQNHQAIIEKAFRRYEKETRQKKQV